MRPLTSLSLRCLGLAAVAALSAPAKAQCPAADSFEPNDSCVGAVMMTAGSTTGLTLFGQANAGGENQDFFQIDVPTGNSLTVDLYFSDANGDTDVYLYDATSPNCGGEGTGDYLVRGFTATDDEHISWPNASGSTQTYWIMVDPYGTSYDCNTYDMTLTIGPDPCAMPTDDSFEENDDCSTATPMVDGLHSGLFVSKADGDYYEVVVADGDTLTVDALFSNASGDIDLEIFLGQADCVGDVVEAGSYSVSDNETVSYTNLSGSQQDVVISVYHYEFDSAADCNDYDLQITGSGGEFATPFCLGDGTTDVGGGPVACPCGNESTLGAGEGCESSLGMGAVLTATGSNVVANDDLVFTITQARANQPSLLIQGVNQVAFPFKDGILCMGTPTERIEVVFLDAAGEGSTTSSIVTEGNVTPGDTRYYQQWYRDPGGVSPCGTGSNFTGGLIVDWQ